LAQKVPLKCQVSLRLDGSVLTKASQRQSGTQEEEEMRAFVQDLRYGFRILARNPGFAAAAIL
jgi:hypothetical protein